MTAAQRTKLKQLLGDLEDVKYRVADLASSLDSDDDESEDFEAFEALDGLDAEFDNLIMIIEPLTEA